MALLLDFKPFPKLFTNRLILRRLILKDENEILFLRSHPKILEFINIRKASSLKDARAYIQMINKGIIKNESILWGMTLQENAKKVIGTICLWNISKEQNRAEIGYVLHPAFQGKGIMQEAVEKVIDYGFKTMNLDTIEADLDPENVRSVRLLERNNFTFEKMNPPLAVYSLKKTQKLPSNNLL
jgi:ribosomal-protein-alanine N-acetyltransferase